MASWTNAFDTTFLAPATAQPARLGDGGCPDTYRLGWLTPIGWCYWTFEAPYDEGTNVNAEGTYLRGQVRRDTRRQKEPTLLLRSANLDTPTRKVLSTVFDSSAVFLLNTDPSGTLSATPVRVATGAVAVNRSRQPIDNFSVLLTLPIRHSFRNL
ncbi:hypothetical protein A6C57_01050 [Fibrella sp. ES10-3-2-2]|nr:hypothetical protein A6C57_01050 [Fibrella sp. ES10-3-2-2]